METPLKVELIVATMAVMIKYVLSTSNDGCKLVGKLGAVEALLVISSTISRSA